MAGPFDNFFGGGGNMFGGGMYADMLSPEQLAAVRQQSMMQVAAKLLEGSGPSPVRRTLGQTLGGALSAGAEAMQSGQTNAVQQMLLRQKLDEAKDARAASENIRGIFTPPAAQAATPLSAQQALIAGSAGRVGPTPQRQNLMTPGAGMPTAGMPAAPGAAMPTAGMPATRSAPQAPPMGLREFAASLPLAEQQSLQAMAQTDPNGALKALNERFMTASSFGKPEFFVRDGQPVAIQYNPLGEGRTVQGVQPYEAMPQDIRAFEYISGGSLAGTGRGGVDALGNYRGQIAPRVSVGTDGGLNLTPLQQARDKDFAKIMNEWESGGGADTVASVAQIGTVLERLESGQPLTGPLIGIQPDFVRAITNPNATNALEQVQEVVQRNLKAILGGAFSEREGQQLISRAYNVNLPPEQNAARLRKLFTQMSISAQQRQAMVDYANANGTLQGYRGPQPNINDFYRALEVQPIGAGANQNLGGAAQQELERRERMGGPR